MGGHSRSLGRISFLSGALGVALGSHGVGLLVAPAWAQPWCAFVCALALFHGLEFAWAARFEPASATSEAFLLDHSPAYHAALAAAALEFWAEALLWPGAKAWRAPARAGLALVVGGQALRTAAMWTAGGHFAHRVAEVQRDGHALVQHGVYARLRHPSYAGWFWWSVGTQLLLANPLCTLGYAVAAWRFFAARIPHEEALLRAQYGEAYATYARRAWVGIPGLEGKAEGRGAEEGRAQRADGAVR